MTRPEMFMDAAARLLWLEDEAESGSVAQDTIHEQAIAYARIAEREAFGLGEAS